MFSMVTSHYIELTEIRHLHVGMYAGFTGRVAVRSIIVAATNFFGLIFIHKMFILV